MMTTVDFKQLEAYKNTAEEKLLVTDICKYLKRRYNVDVYKCVIKYQQDSQQIEFLAIYLKENSQWKKFVDVKNKSKMWLEGFHADGKTFCTLFQKHNFHYNPVFERGMHIAFYSFEFEAVNNAYQTAYRSIKKFRRKYFNPQTMDWMYPRALFIVYKNQESLLNSEMSGEQKRLKKVFYNMIKKYDKYQYITFDKHLLFKFETVESAHTPTQYFDMFISMMEE